MKVIELFSLQRSILLFWQIAGKDTECIIRRWLLTNVVYPYNCTLSYLNISKIPISNVSIAKQYFVFYLISLKVSLDNFKLSKNSLQLKFFNFGELSVICLQPCEPLTLASDYYNAIQLVWTSSTVKETVLFDIAISYLRCY